MFCVQDVDGNGGVHCRGVDLNPGEDAFQRVCLVVHPRVVVHVVRNVSLAHWCSVYVSVVF
jgi:hypothetical protein